ncbi:MAG: GIY-YIG nuclease family protein [Alphaproteobacteria bacterium]|nr:GIY-YIG nuclease family protein [Alphaproteobacteria bacterium]QQS57643.1 MAG: GIY-YIG nuclease family protein [Alphaproteobacteria bacterium]
MTLDDILALDDDLLDVKLSSNHAGTEDQRILSVFEEINLFIDKHKRKPAEGKNPSVFERSLKIKLSGILNDANRHDFLLEHDRHGLLPSVPVKSPKTLDEILDLDDDLLTTPKDDIFNLVHVLSAADRPDMISDRRPCLDFESFKPLFEKCSQEINTGKRKTLKFSKEQEINAGEFFILNGVMVYVAEVGETHIRNGKKNARLRLIFDNGMEGKNLLRSLATELYKDKNGRRVSNPEVGGLFDSQPEEGDLQTGMIYVVRSLSPDPEIKKYDGMLHKIGFTSGKMEIRIQNAKDDPTFLMAAVHPVATYILYNIDKVKLEYLLHSFFAEARLDIDIADRFGKKIKPREWFLLKYETIAEAVSRLKDGSIVDYKFDLDTGNLILREQVNAK